MKSILGMAAIVVTIILTLNMTPLASAIITPGPPGITAQLGAINHQLVNISNHLNKVLQPPGSPDDKALVAQLGAIEAHLDGVARHLDRISTHMPPGPSDDKAVIAELLGIVNNANAIAGTVAQMPPGPGNLQDKLDSIVIEAGIISSMAQNMLNVQTPGQ
jgi:hypothetical protein